MNRTLAVDVKNHIGEEVMLKGWVHPNPQTDWQDIWEAILYPITIPISDDVMVLYC